MIAARHSTIPIQNTGEWWMRRQSRVGAFDFISMTSSARRGPMSVGYCDVRLYWQIILPSGCEQNSIFPVHRSSRCTPIDDETICHLNSIASEITMSTVATMTVAGMREAHHSNMPLSPLGSKQNPPKTLTFSCPETAARTRQRLD